MLKRSLNSKSKRKSPLSTSKLTSQERLFTQQIITDCLPSARSVRCPALKELTDHRENK